MNTMQTISADNFSLVLSGGGALGIAHLGVLSDMQKRGLSPREIIGTSMGAIIGACISIGMTESEIFEQILKFSSVKSWIKFSFNGNAIVENNKIDKIFKEIFGSKKMSDTKIPLKIIATDLLSGHKRVFDSSDDLHIKDAILASMAIPGVFEEKHIKGRVFVDGFLCENLGLREATLDSVLAIDVLGEHSFGKEMPDNIFKTSNVVEMFERSMRLLIYNQTQTILDYSDKNILLLEPKTQEYNTFHFHKAKEIRALGLGLLGDYPKEL
jgi:NTE family protein